MGDSEGVFMALVEYFEAENGWSVDVEKGEAEMSSGYGSGPAVIDLNALAVAISKKLWPRIKS